MDRADKPRGKECFQQHAVEEVVSAVSLAQVLTYALLSNFVL